jgi:hypothetical protein
MNVDRARKDLESFVASQVNDLAVRSWQLAVDLSPVWTGSYRNAWTVSHSSPRYRYKRLSREFNPNAPKPSKPRIQLGRKPFKRVYLTNGSPYAELVEFGGPNNPAHYVLQRVMEAVR